MPQDILPLGSDFGDQLRTQRIVGGLNQAELAERAGLGVRGLSDLERGVRTRPQRETVQRLLAALASAALGAVQLAALETSLQEALGNTEFAMATERGRSHPVNQTLSLAHKSVVQAR